MKSLIFLCVLALIIEVVMPAPGVFDLQAYQDNDNTADLEALDLEDMALRDRRSKTCLTECFACSRMVSKINPSQCVNGCQSGSKGMKGTAAKTWTICFMALQRRK